MRSKSNISCKVILIGLGTYQVVIVIINNNGDDDRDIIITLINYNTTRVLML